MSGGWKVHDASTWTLQQGAMFVMAIQLGMELLHRAVIPLVFGGAPPIPMSGKHLDKFSPKDISFIVFNKLATCLFIYHVCQYVCTTERIYWSLEEVSIANCLLPLPVFYVIYDLVYVLFHRALHLRAFYALIHKHHHRQGAPTRGNYDAMNVHPFEFLVGEYLHLFCIALIPCHIYAAALFIAVGGLFASLNHTRHDVSFGKVFAVRAHDLHHHLYLYNYGQYTMFWDHAFGTFRESNAKSRSERVKEY